MQDYLQLKHMRKVTEHNKNKLSLPTASCGNKRK